MDPKKIGENYDNLADYWCRQQEGSSYGVAALQRAIRFVRRRGRALDVGCGSEGRFMRIFQEEGFTPQGVDISGEMIARIRQRHPNATFFRADICEWKLPQRYDLITAWDSTFHLPLKQQEPVLEKLCHGLTDGGVILFTCGDRRGEITGSFEGYEFGYSSLGISGFVEILSRNGCELRHLEFDQHPEPHVFMVAQKT